MNSGKKTPKNIENSTETGGTKYPKVYISNVALSESHFKCGSDPAYSAPKLIQYCKEQAYPIFNLPLAGIDMTCAPFTLENMRDFIFQCKRVRDCDTSYPIILDDCGQIADGYHRVCKAILNGDTTIKAIRIEKMP